MTFLFNCGLLTSGFNIQLLTIVLTFSKSNPTAKGVFACQTDAYYLISVKFCFLPTASLETILYIFKIMHLLLESLEVYMVTYLDSFTK